MELTLIILASFSLIAIAELLKRKFSLPTALTRRFAHATTAIVAGIAPLFVTQTEIIVVSIVFAAILLFDRRFRMFSAIHPVERRTFGDVFLPLGVAGSALLFLPNTIAAFQFGIFVMGIADALAGVVGEKFGKHPVRIFNNTKSLEGSAVFFIATLVITIFFVTAPIHQILFIVAVLTATEFFAVYGLDNLILPILGGFLLQIFM